MADRNPGNRISPTRPPSNHPNIGTNGVDAGGNLMQYEKISDSKCGMNGDEIYRDFQLDDLVPDSTSDTVIVPYNSRE